MIRTALTARLSDGEKKKLAEYACQKFDALHGAMKSWRSDRERYRMISEQDFSWRQNRTQDDGLGNQIWDKSNIPTNFIVGAAEFMIARTCEDIYGSDPWLHVSPEGKNDAELASQIEKHALFKLREADAAAKGKASVAKAFHIGESLEKVVYERTQDHFERLARVMVDTGKKKADERPVLLDGEYIEETDHSLAIGGLGLMLWAKDQIIEIPQGYVPVEPQPGAPAIIVAEANGEPLTYDDGDPVYAADISAELEEMTGARIACRFPMFAQTEVHDFEERVIDEVQTRFSGLKITSPSFQDIATSLLNRSLELEVDGNDYFGERMGMRLSKLVNEYDLDDDLIAKLKNESTTPKSDAATHEENRAEEAFADHYDPNEDPIIEVIEAHMLYDVFGEHRPRRIWGLFIKSDMELVTADYLANVVPEAKLPVSVTRAIAMPGRWYGRSYYEVYEHEMDFIDRFFNHVVYRNEFHSNPVKLFNPQMLEQDDGDSEPEIGPDVLLKPKNPDTPAEHILKFITIPDADHRTMDLLNMVMQMAQVRSGVTSAAQGDFTSLPSTSTATGTQSILQSGSTLHKLPIENIREGQDDLYFTAIQLLYANQDYDETYSYLEGDAEMVGTLNARSVRGLRMNVRLLLTKLHEREALESSKAAIDAIAQYLQFPEAEKDSVRPLFVQLLKALRISDADSIVREPIQMEQVTEAEEEQPSISINYKDAPEDIKRQMEEAAGFQPSTLPPPADPDARQAPPSDAPPAVGVEEIPVNAE